MQHVQILHNPKCSKSRQTLALLQDKGIQPEIIDYLNQAPSAEFLDSTLRKLNMEPTAIIRSKEALFKQLDLSLNCDRSRQEWLDILNRHPRLIERPIVIVGNKAAIGRPPENILTLL